MNWDQMEGKWKQMKGRIKKQWGQLTDDDLQYMSGSKDQFVGRLQERYGIAKEEAQRQADLWFQSQAEQAEDDKRTEAATRRSGGSAG